MTRADPRPTSRRVPVRAGGFSRLLDLRLLAVCAGALVVGVVAIALSVSVGEFPIPLGDVAATLVGSGTFSDEFIIVGLRLPRALVGLGCGMALGVSGLIFQTLVRNPLAAPDIIGVTGGASLTGVAILILGAPPALLPLGAFAGAVASATLVYALAWRGGLSPYRLVLIGIALAAVSVAGTQYLLVIGDLIDVQRAAVWLVGSLNGVTWAEFWPLLVGLVLLFPATAALARALDALSLSEESATALGVRVSALPPRSGGRRRGAGGVRGGRGRADRVRRLHRPAPRPPADRAHRRGRAARDRPGRRGAGDGLRPRRPPGARAGRAAGRRRHGRRGRALLPLPALPRQPTRPWRVTP